MRVASGAVAGSCAAAAAKSQIEAGASGRSARPRQAAYRSRSAIGSTCSSRARASTGKLAEVGAQRVRRGRAPRARATRTPSATARWRCAAGDVSSGSATASRCTWSEFGSSTTIGRPVAPSSRSNSTPVVYVLPEPDCPHMNVCRAKPVGPQAGRRRRHRRDRLWRSCRPRWWVHPRRARRRWPAPRRRWPRGRRAPERRSTTACTSIGLSRSDRAPRRSRRGPRVIGRTVAVATPGPSAPSLGSISSDMPSRSTTRSSRTWTTTSSSS